MSTDLVEGNALQNAILTRSEEGDTQDSLSNLKNIGQSKYNDNTNLSQYFSR